MRHGRRPSRHTPRAAHGKATSEPSASTCGWDTRTSYGAALLPPRKTYTASEIDAGLLALALADGKPSRAHEHLPAGVTIPARTIRRWSETHADRYRELAAQEKPRLAEKMIAGFEKTIMAATDVANLALEKTRQELEAGKTRDPSGAARNAATVAGIATDKLHAITGKPGAVIEHRHDVQGDLRILERLGVIDTTAQEVNPLELAAAYEDDDQQLDPHCPRRQ